MQHTFLLPRWLCALVFVSVISLNTANAQQIITTVAGGIGDDTTALVYGRIWVPTSLAFNGASNLYVCEGYGGVRKLNTSTDIITTVTNAAGKGVFDVGGN